jgi:hypothetical protein
MSIFRKKSSGREQLPSQATSEIYFDADFERDRRRGYDDAIAGRKCIPGNVVSVSAYTSGHSEGSDVLQALLKKKKPQKAKEAELETK